MPAHPESLWHQKRFIAFWLAFCCSNVALQMASTAVAWQMYALTGRASDLGMIGLAQFLPALIFLLPAGHIADRYNRRQIVIAANVASFAVMVGMLLISLRHEVNHLGLLALVTIGGAASALRGPCFQSMVPGLVQAKTFARATASSAVAGEIAVVLGPMLGGLLYMAGPAAVYSSAGLLLAGSVMLLSSLGYTQAALPRGPLTRKDLFAGIVFVRSRPVLFAVISLDLFAVLLGGATALLPIFAKDVLHTGPWGLGLLRMAPSVGSVVLGLWLASHPLQRSMGVLMFGSVAGFGLSTIGFALSTSLWPALISLVALGAFDMVSMVIRGALLQLDTPDAMRGRVSAISSIFVTTSNQLGAFESGMVAALIGAVPAVIVGGCGTLIVTALWMRWFPVLLRRQTLQSSSDSGALEGCDLDLPAYYVG
jgi:MFS family permease